MGPEPDAPRARIKKSGEIAAWVVHCSGTEIGHKGKDCFGCEGWEAQTYRSDYLATSTPPLKSSVEMREGHSVLFHLLPHSCFTDCLRQPRGMRCGEVQGDQVSVSTRGHCPSGQAAGLLPEVSVQLGNQVSEQASRDSRSKFTIAPGSGCLSVSFS